MMRPRRALRASSAIALVLCLFAQLAGSMHSATVRHVACSEHGGVVELHGGAASPSRRVAHAAIVETDDAAHHAHCDRCATPTAKIGIAAVHAHVGLVIVATNAARTATTLDEPIARLHLAPKGSPPPLSTI